MASEMAAMLDELMGANRDALPGEKSAMTFEHPRVCKYFLAGFCPHDLFTNTKYDLGICRMLHDNRYKVEYTESPMFEKLGYEDKFQKFLSRLQMTMKDKVGRHRDRLKLTQRDIGSHQEASSLRGDPNREQMVTRIEQLTVHINDAVDATDKLRLEGNAEGCSAQGAVADAFKMERTSINEQMMRFDADNGGQGGGRALEVCDTCGCFLVWNDAQVRVDEHLAGKLHMGYAKIKVTIDEMEKRRHERMSRRSPTPERRRRSPERRRSVERRHSKERSSRRSRSREGRHKRETRNRSRSPRRSSRRSRSRSPRHRDSRHKESRRSRRSPDDRRSDRRRSRSPKQERRNGSSGDEGRVKTEKESSKSPSMR